MKGSTAVNVINAAFAIGALLLLVAGALTIYPNYNRNNHLKVELEEMDKAIQEQRRVSQQLRAEIEALRTDNQTIERTAREHFDLCREGETIYQFEDAGRRDPISPPR
ncbi:MAG: septum formation initiator family protein [Lentisphaeria bacterium]